jgi:hypothetical protein
MFHRFMASVSRQNAMVIDQPILGKDLSAVTMICQETQDRMFDELCRGSRVMLDPSRGKRHTTASEIRHRMEHFKHLPVFKSSLHSTVV